MLSRAQQILLKRAQREAGLGDFEYRDALAIATGYRSSTDPGMTDRHLDVALAYLEAIYFRKADRGELQPSCRSDAVFRQRGHWASKNTHQETSRDRYTGHNLVREIAALEASLAALGFGPAYCTAIRQTVTHGRTDAHAQHTYKAALQRTLRAKAKQSCSDLLPAELAG